MLNQKWWFWLGGLFSLVLLVGIGLNMSGKKTMVTRVEASGRLELSDGRVVSLAGLRMRTPGEEKYEAAKFLLSQMVEGKEVVVSKEGEAGYSVWIGCVRNIFGSPNCSRGLRVNEELAKVGAAERR